MALIHCDFFSEVLELSTSMCVILPQITKPDIQKSIYQGTYKYPTLYLLHGMSDDHTIWQRRTSIERYVDPLGLAVVMPAVQRSFYTDMAYGKPYWTFISEELPALARTFFPLSEERADNFVAGLSMGGYGAFKLALSHPERYAAAASLSGAVDIVSTANTPLDPWSAEMRSIFGELPSLPGSKNDLYYLAKQVADFEISKPLLYQWCGKDDFLYGDNVRFRDYIKTLDLDLTYEEGPGGHEWACWDAHIPTCISLAPIKPPTGFGGK